MKKVISLVLVVLTLFSVMAISVSAKDTLCPPFEHDWYEDDRGNLTCTGPAYIYYKCTKCTLGYKAEKYSDSIPHIDDNHDGKCDACKGDSTLGCNCLCHKVKPGREGILSPLASLVQLFRIIFKINHYCKCGYHEINKR